NFLAFSIGMVYKELIWWSIHGLLKTSEKQIVIKITKRLDSKKIKANPRNIVDSFDLSFWIKLLSKPYHETIWLKIIKYFPTHPGRREDFYKRAREIRNLRNLIAHHAPILHRNLLRDHQSLHELTMILDPQLAQEVQKRSRVLDLLLNTRLVGSGGGI
ncbi:MAG: hypothetical protein RL590_1062, partial [Actinomycetota bacterium]